MVKEEPRQEAVIEVFEAEDGRYGEEARRHGLQGRSVKRPGSGAECGGRCAARQAGGRSATRKDGRPYKRKYAELDQVPQSNSTESREPHHEDFF